MLRKLALIVGFCLTAAAVAQIGNNALAIRKGYYPHLKATKVVLTSQSSSPRRGMNACPESFFMTGAHLGMNVFECTLFIARKDASTYVLTYDDEYEIVDAKTSRNGMHTCPSGMAMTGFHEKNNWLLCAPFGNIYQPRDDCPRCPRTYRFFWFTREYVDRPDLEFHARSGMHTCRPHSPMTGIHVAHNAFSCIDR